MPDIEVTKDRVTILRDGVYETHSCDHDYIDADLDGLAGYRCEKCGLEVSQDALAELRGGGRATH